MVSPVGVHDRVLPAVMSEPDLRRQIDRSVCRALVDGEYAALLLSDPTLVLEQRNCLPQHYLSLLSVQAGTLLDFARQVQAMFWAYEHSDTAPIAEDALPLAAAVR